MRVYRFEKDGEELKIPAEKIAGRLWFHHKGETHCYDLHSENKSGSQKAPMPGRVIAVKAQKGEVLQKGDVVLIMEAMKMEYVLEAGVNGVLKELNAKEGESVSQGQCLAVLDLEESPDA